MREHGSIVTQEDLMGLTDDDHWLGRWRKGFGKDTPSNLVGVATNYVVNTLSDSTGRTLRAAQQSNTPHLISFDPALGDGGIITMNSDVFFRLNKLIDARGVRIRTEGSGSWVPSTSAGLHYYGSINMRYRHGVGGAGEGSDIYEFWGSHGTGPLPVWFLNNWFDRPVESDQADGSLDIDNGPNLGFWVSLFCNRFGNDSVKIGKIMVFGNNRTDQFNEHTRVSMYRNGFWGFNGVRSRMPLLTDARMDSGENLRQYGFEGSVSRNATGTSGRARVRHRWEIFDGQFIESPTNNHPISVVNGAYVRNENILSFNDTDMAVFEENNRNAVTDASIYIDESGNSLAQYNDYTPDLSGMTPFEASEFVKSFCSQFTEINLSGIGSSIAAQDVDNEQIILTDKFDPVPTWSDADKQRFIDVGIEGGPNVETIKANLSPQDVQVSGSQIQVVIPAGTASQLSGDVDETMRFIVPGDLLGGGVRTGAEQTVLIGAETAAPTAPGRRTTISPMSRARLRRLAV